MTKEEIKKIRKKLGLTQKEFGQFLSFSNYKTEPKDENYEDYLKALENGNAYSVWTPTSGDLRGDKLKKSNWFQ